jgi:hypothetical protein
VYARVTRKDLPGSVSGFTGRGIGDVAVEVCGQLLGVVEAAGGGALGDVLLKPGAALDQVSPGGLQARGDLLVLGGVG